MNTIIANPMFSSIVVLIVGSVIWLGLADGDLKEKKALLSIFMDIVFYFVILLFGFNAVLNLGEIIDVPYRVLLFSSNIVWLATLAVGIYGGIKYGRQLWEQPNRTKSVSILLLVIGLVNHLQVYFLYSSPYSLRFIGLFAVTLLLISFTRIFSKINPLLVFLAFGLLHALLMGSRAIIYFNFTFSALPLAALFVALTGLLYYQRRTSLSEPN
ncbi:MAG: hypothetical protein JJU01_03915 [Alkalibacterium sp.]|nr:hypothetical protein [Alkalibacterium sp.]TVP93120.1 MAG: hypothetical protein EA249_00970 [Alkalibacterium sp.]